MNFKTNNTQNTTINRTKPLLPNGPYPSFIKFSFTLSSVGIYCPRLTFIRAPEIRRIIMVNVNS